MCGLWGGAQGGADVVPPLPPKLPPHLHPPSRQLSQAPAVRRVLHFVIVTSQAFELKHLLWYPQSLQYCEEVKC